MLKLVKDNENPTVELDESLRRLEVAHNIYALIMVCKALRQQVEERPDLFARHVDALNDCGHELISVSRIPTA